MLIFVRTDKQTQYTLSAGVRYVCHCLWYQWRRRRQRQQSTSSYQAVVWDEQTQKTRPPFFISMYRWISECCVKSGRQVAEKQTEKWITCKNKWHFDLKHTHLRCWKTPHTSRQNLFSNNKDSTFIWRCVCIFCLFSFFFTINHWSRCTKFWSYSLKMQRKWNNWIEKTWCS